jgi:hypothetical protein
MMSISRRALFGALPLLASAARGQSPPEDWPKRPIHFIVSSAPGSAGDAVCRIVGQKLGERLGQQFVMDNRPAVGGTLAAEALARAAPDGYTIGMVTTSTHVIAKIFDPTMPRAHPYQRRLRRSQAPRPRPHRSAKGLHFGGSRAECLRTKGLSADAKPERRKRAVYRTPRPYRSLRCLQRATAISSLQSAPASKS